MFGRLPAEPGPHQKGLVMTVRHRRLAMLTIGIASLSVMFSAGVANAAPPGYAYNDGGPFATQAICNAESAQGNDPPTVYTFACGYYTSDPLPPGPNGPGWYYLIKYSII
jgi:hypothetical protein